MARKPKTTPAAAAAAPEGAEDGVRPVFALTKVVYGAQKTAAPSSVFTPSNEDEREELFKLEAVRELTADEAAVFGLAAPAADAGDGEAGDDAAGDGDGDQSQDDAADAGDGEAGDDAAGEFG